MNEFQSNPPFTPSNTQHLSFGGTYHRCLCSPLEMSEELSRITLWCTIGFLPRPIAVTVPESANIYHLKEVIMQQSKLTVAPHNMDLWKLINPEPVEPYKTLANRMSKLQGENFEEFAELLTPTQKVLDLFPVVSLPNSNVQVIVELPESRLANSLLPSEADLRIFHEALQKIDNCPDWYSNPHNMDLLPFPLLFSHLPTERFLLDRQLVKAFEYMGRERFGNLWEHVQSLQIGSGLSQLFLYGNMGSGKSHMLAALVCLLFRLGNRPVYIPDYWQMLLDPLPYIQSALLCSFADAPSLAFRNKIRSFQKINDAIIFCRNLGTMRLYFIIDQMNTLEEELPNTDSVSNPDKQELRAFLHRISTGHYSITSASANYRTAQHMAQKQTGDIKMSMMGGMSKEEVEQWWVHHQGKLPSFKHESDKDRVKDLTGCIPLLLRPLLQWRDRDFREIEQSFWLNKDLITVNQNISHFAKMKLEQRGAQNYALYYIKTLFACLSGLVSEWILPDWLDHRYFWQDEQTRRCYSTCGLARQAGAIIVRKTKPDQFLDVIWLNSLDAFEDNPVVVGFIIEQTCLSAMSSLGFNYGDLHWNSVKSQIFTGDILDALGEISPQTLYIPDQWNYKDINALYLAIDEKKKTMLIVPIQISINPCHKDSETLFYADWAKWKNKFHGYTLSSTFVWIVEHKCSWNIVEEQLRSLRGGTQVIAPQHKQMHVMVSDVYKPLGERLEARYRRLQKKQPSRKMGINESARQSESEEKIISEDFSEVTEELFKSTQIEAESTVMLTGSKGKAVEKVKDNDGSYKDSADMGASNKGRDVTKEIHKGDKKSTATVKRKRTSHGSKSNKKATPASRKVKRHGNEDDVDE